MKSLLQFAAAGLIIGLMTACTACTSWHALVGLAAGVILVKAMEE